MALSLGRSAARGRVGQCGAMRETTCCHGDVVPHAGKALFADAEIAENHVQDVLDVDPAGEPPQGASGDAQLFGQQILMTGEPRRQRPLQRRQGILQRTAVALARHQRRLGAGQKTFGVAGEGGKQQIEAFSGRRRKIELMFIIYELSFSTSC